MEVGSKAKPPDVVVTRSIANVNKKTSIDFMMGFDIFGYYVTSGHKIIGVCFSCIPQKKKGDLAQLSVSMEEKHDGHANPPCTCLLIRLAKVSSLSVFGGTDITPNFSLTAGVGAMWSTWCLKDQAYDIMSLIGVGETIRQMNFFLCCSARFKPFKLAQIALSFSYVFDGNMIKNVKNPTYAIIISRMTLMLSILINIPMMRNKLCIGGGFTCGLATKKMSDVVIENLDQLRAVIRR